MIKVFKLLKNSKIKGYKMKTIKIGGCASVKDACL